jgi:Leucine-rich repeat (LRR) protein
MTLLAPYLSKLLNLKELNLEENSITSMPNNLRSVLPSLMNMNLNCNDFDDDLFPHVIEALRTLPRLESLYINLHTEDQVDLVMRVLDNLKFLNGLPVERDILEEEEEDEES